MPETTTTTEANAALDAAALQFTAANVAWVDAYNATNRDGATVANLGAENAAKAAVGAARTALESAARLFHRANRNAYLNAPTI